ncbi:muscarinic acetylcholine receptor DM1-like [Uloborus diversus]|uniref:muscarinic acetylcholine receptor DM1-like n=1 Tax=Uloborus diversus TaxID=327109 RepID=UPI0024095B38|nr:muscarinic acetylcholine receptor DM1-like [Uloborus diversus]
MAFSSLQIFSTTSSMAFPVTSHPFNESNVTIGIIAEPEIEKPPYSIFEMILIAIVAGMLSIITVIGNIMVMISFKMDKQLQTISNYFLLSLAVADFSIGLISMPLFTMYLLIGTWPLGDFVCDSWLAFDYLNSNASVLNLLIISFDRYFSVTRPLTYRALRTTRRAAFMIASAWVISLMLWPPWIYAWPYIEGRRTVKKNHCYIQFLETNSYVTFGTALAAFYVPVTVMCFLYWRIWRETKQRQKDLTHLQAGKKEDSRKSTSSDDPPDHEEAVRKIEECKRYRTDSCVLEETTETTYVPTSLCVETSKYLPKNKESKTLKITELLRAWCRIDREGDPQEEESTSHESPVTTPASLETPMQPCSRTASMSFRIDHRIPLQSQSFAPSTSSHKTNDQAIPMTERNGQKRFEPTIPEWKRQIMSPRTATTPLVTPPMQTAVAGSSVTSLRSHIPPPTQLPSPQPSIYSPDSVYTILIRLPPKSASIEGEGESQASIKMIMEDEETSADAIESIQDGESSDIKNPLESGTADSLLKAADSAVDAIRLPLNTKLVHKQVAKHRAPKKKRKQQERKQEMKAAKTLSAILFAFTVTWTPYNVLVLYKTLSNCEDDDCITPGLWNFAYYLCYINSTVNPFCYALCNANFRRTYTRILSCKWHNKKKTLDNRGYFT